MTCETASGDVFCQGKKKRSDHSEKNHFRLLCSRVTSRRPPHSHMAGRLLQYCVEIIVMRPAYLPLLCVAEIISHAIASLHSSIHHRDDVRCKPFTVLRTLCSNLKTNECRSLKFSKMFKCSKYFNLFELDIGFFFILLKSYLLSQNS